ncbi:kinase-like domain-containing protein [Radiomyces spectabilis]|uniref:kinase-like domain-containing protein n=1 Tax=Radiomyces spectabilis TaxID=64574 RepID=UPI0022201FB7|nr:kinase-like domain-containing protein [Radiomyces spectabilis]KAI8393515.1 kinase-like domain-containing protein [Radiomyces spectabilis]
MGLETRITNFKKTRQLFFFRHPPLFLPSLSFHFISFFFLYCFLQNPLIRFGLNSSHLPCKKRQIRRNSLRIDFFLMPFITALSRTSTEHRYLFSHHKQREIGDYVLGRTIGRGASGRVKLAVNRHTGEQVAIKMIARCHLIGSTEKAVQRELAVLQLLNHPHLVQLKQVLQDSTYVYFVMEYLEGGELFHLLAQRGRLPENEAKCLFRQLAQALAWCHAHHISHRDLKPENVLLDKTQKLIKIADFGMAAMQVPNAHLKTSCGSPHYASPEIVRGRPYNGPLTDVWSCGVILYALLTGHLPFDDEHMGRLLAKIKSGHYRPVSENVSCEARDLIRRMLVVQPSKRLTMDEVLKHPWLLEDNSPNGPYIIHPIVQSMSPLKNPYLHHPIAYTARDLDGRVWETLKVLWQDKTPLELLLALASHGPNIQKLTCHLLQERLQRLEGEVYCSSNANGGMHNYNLYGSNTSYPPDSCHASPHYWIHRASLAADDTNSVRHSRRGSDECSLPTTSDSTMSTVSCCRTLDSPLTPNSSLFELDFVQVEIMNKRFLADQVTPVPLSIPTARNHLSCFDRWLYSASAGLTRNKNKSCKAKGRIAEPRITFFTAQCHTDNNSSIMIHLQQSLRLTTPCVSRSACLSKEQTAWQLWRNLFMR